MYTGSGRKLFHEIHFSPAFIFEGANRKIVLFLLLMEIRVKYGIVQCFFNLCLQTSNNVELTKILL
jgi:hypothetical protein